MKDANSITQKYNLCQAKNSHTAVRRSANWQITLGGGTVFALSDFEDAGLSYVPCGQYDGEDKPLLKYRHLWDIRKQATLDNYGKVSTWVLKQMIGVQLMTGNPTYRRSETSPTGYAHLTDIDIERKLIDTHPDIVDRVVDAYRNDCDRAPVIIETKSGGRRLSAFCDYLDPKREYHAPDDSMFMEIFSLKGLSRLDHRYSIIEGNILDLPVIPKSALQKIHAIVSEVATHKQSSKQDRDVVEKSQLGDLDVEWNADGISQYFSASHCQKTSHKTTRETVQFIKIRDGVLGKCYNCSESWWENEPTPLLPTGIEPIKALPTDHPMLANAPEYEDIYAKRRASVRLSHLDDYIPKSIALETARKLNHEGVSEWLERTRKTLSTFDCVVTPIIKDKEKRPNGLNYSQQPGWWNHRGRMRIKFKYEDLIKLIIDKVYHSQLPGWWDHRKPIKTEFKYKDVITPIIKKMRVPTNYGMQPGWWDHWAKTRSIIRERLKHQRHMLVLTGSAGGGKSTASRENLTEFADISPTTAQADEKYEDALTLGRNAMRHRSRNYNKEAADNLTPETVPIGLDAELDCVPCASPDIPNMLAQIGGSPVSEYCKPHCPRFEECKDYGYLSQWRIFRDHNEIYLSYQDDVFSDPLYAGYIEQMSGSKKDFVLCLDEVDPASLPPERGYSTDKLKQTAKDYADIEAGVFLTQLIKETSNAITAQDWTKAVKEVLGRYDNETLDEIDHQLQGIPVSVTYEQVDSELIEYDLNQRAMYLTLAHITYRTKTVTCAVLCDEIEPSVYEVCTKMDYPSISAGIIPKGGWIACETYTRLLWLETFCQIGFGNMNTADDVFRLPHRYRNLTADLRAFIESVNSDTPAAKAEKVGDVSVGWTFYLRPDMNARRGILISASGGYDEIEELYAHTDIQISHVTTLPVEWKGGNKLFQLSTGRYTPKSALLITDKSDPTQFVGITDRCRGILNIIHTEVTQKPVRSLVVVPKALTAEGDLAELDEVKVLLELEHVDVINHWHAEGTNRYTGVENIFILHYEPSVDEIQSIATRIYRNETLSFEREKVDWVKDGVKLEGVFRYTDTRVQSVFDRECEKRIYQALMRGRQMLDTGVDCYTYLFTAEPISGLPIKPVFFELGDAQYCLREHSTLRELEEYLASKAEMSVEELAEKEGKSIRTAYRRKAKMSKQTKDEQDAELRHKAKEMIHKGSSQRGAALMLGISLGKLQTLLKKDK